MPPEKRTKESDNEEKINKRKSLTFLEKRYANGKEIIHHII